jgi:hypothetical protein
LCEFVASHRSTGQAVAVEAKSRHRPGVLNTKGERDEGDPLRGDARAVRRLFVKAIEKAPEGLPFMIFIDINAASELARGQEKEWERDIRGWMERFPVPTRERPDVFNAMYVTNFSPHYFGPDIARGGELLSVRPRYARTPTAMDLGDMLDHALTKYGRVPDISENGEVR